MKKLILAFIVLSLLLPACKKEEKEKTYPQILLGALDKGKIDRTKDDLKAIADALSSYQADTGSYPVGEGVGVLKSALSPNYLVLLPERDAWGNPFSYHSNGRSYRIVAPGKDGQEGTADDIVLSDGMIVSSPKLR
ncbi:MAG: type II secretion system protein GspG [Acidobacteria bacterium]|nr:type II secretion system protein GspG [Acidobacteriota bacterium]